MNVWKLSINDSPGYVRIRAANEARAREIANEIFTNKNVAKIIHAVNWSEVSWTDSNEVQCEMQEEDMSDIEGILDIV